MDLNYPFPILVALIATFFLAGMVKGVTGMGLPTLAMGMAGAFISPLAAASLLIVPSFVTNVWQLLAGPSLAGLLKRLWPMMVAIIIGTVVGAALLAGGDTGLTVATLGTALVIYALYALFGRPLLVPQRFEPVLSPVIGGLTGLVTGGTGVFVIPAVPYLQSLGLERDELVQALGLSFTVSTIALAVGLAGHQAYRMEDLLLSVLLVLPSLAGMWVGQSLRSRISPTTFRRWFLICLLLLGAQMLLRPLF